MSAWPRVLAPLALLVVAHAHAQHQHDAAAAPTESEREHVAPDPPQSHVDHDMSYREMAQIMGMDDRRRFGKVMFDRLEWIDADESIFGWDAAAWYGGDIHKLRAEAEGERAAGATQSARFELAWDRVVSRWWSARAGVRQDSGHGPSRTWAAFGFSGLAPGFFETDIVAYLGESGRTALRLSTEYDLRITQRWILQPELELEAFGRGDPERMIGAGLATVELALRLRYEIRREFAPYVGVGWQWRFGESADLARAAGEDTAEFAVRAGIRAWF